MALEVNKDKLELNITSNPLQAFEQYLSLVNPIVPDKLKPLEMKVLSIFMYINYTNRELSKDKRDLIIFSKDTKRRICRKLVISEDAVNNVISSLYKKKYLSKDKKYKVFMPFDGEKINLIYRIKLTNELDTNLELPLDDKNSEEDL